MIVIGDLVSQEEESLGELVRQRLLEYPLLDLRRRFDDRVRTMPGAKILDIGGRKRSIFDSKSRMNDLDLTVFDIVDVEGVDVVGDAHFLGNYFEPESFDYALSISVFEHLHSPWRVVTELGKVLKQGGQALIQTHQTIGMHDLPFDFWRISGDAWPALFNELSGFRVLEVVQDHEMHILPFVYSQRHAEAEATAGFEVSAVIVERTGSPAQTPWKISKSLGGGYVGA